MRVLGSNYKDFYKNPNAGDFANGLVDLRRTHLNDLISVWNEFDEETRGTLQGNPGNFNYLSIYTQQKNAPNIIKIITEDGFEGFFYKRNMGAIVNDSKDSLQTINYELNKGDTYLGKKFGALNDLNPYVETLNLHSDILIFYGNLNDIDTTSPLLVSSESEEDIRKAFNKVINADTDNWKTGDINAYYDVKIDTDNKLFEILPTSNNDISYLIGNIKDNFQELYNLKQNNIIEEIKFDDLFDIVGFSSAGSGTYHNISFDDGSYLRMGKDGSNNINLDFISKDGKVIYIWNNGNFQQSGNIGGLATWDLQSKTLTFYNNRTITGNQIVNGDYNGSATANIIQQNFQGNYQISTDTSPQQVLLGFRFNILEQKQFGDTNINDNFQLVRRLIGSKTADELYTYNEILPDDTITLKCYDSSVSSATHNITYRELDNLSGDADKNVYKAIGCKMSALKHVEPTKVYESMGGQYQLYAPIGDNQITLLDKLGDGLEPPTSSISPEPFNVLFAPFSTGSKLTDATLMDIPNGLIFGLGLKQLSTSEAIFVNDGTYDSSHSSVNYDGSDTNSFPLFKFPTNHSIQVKISGLSEENSLENKIKTMIQNISMGIYDMDTEPLFLNPKYFYEAIVYDNSNFIKIDASGINYETRADELTNDGLVLCANFCINDNMSLYYSFDKASENSKIGNNELNILGNNTKTNLGVVNNRTTLELGSNAENLANGGALATYVGYQNYKTKLQQQTMNYDFSQAGNAFNIGTSAFKDFASGNVSGGVKDLLFGGAKMYQQAQNFKMDILNQNRAYNAQISQIRSANAIDVSAPYSTSFGKQPGLFTRYAYEIQDWNKISKFKEINKNGYFYKDVLPFQRGDNRVYGNALKISSATNYKYIIQQLENDENFGSYDYCEELLLGLMGGVRIWNISKMDDEINYQNIPKILPPYENQKIDGRKFFNWEELAEIGLIGDTSMSWDVDGDLRKRVILALQQHATPDLPSDLLDDMNSKNFKFSGDNGNLIIQCLSSDLIYLPTFEEIGNVLITDIKNFANIGSFVINDYANLKDYFDLHIESYLNISKQTGNGDSEDYSYADKTHLHIQIKNTFINLTILDYSFVESDTQSIGKVIICGDLNFKGDIIDNPTPETPGGCESWIKFDNSNDDKHCFPFLANSNHFISNGGGFDGATFAICMLIYYYFDFYNLKFKETKPTNSQMYVGNEIADDSYEINNENGYIFLGGSGNGSDTGSETYTRTYKSNLNFIDSLNFNLSFPNIHGEIQTASHQSPPKSKYDLTIDTINSNFKDTDTTYFYSDNNITITGYDELNNTYNLPTSLTFTLANADYSFTTTLNYNNSNE